MGGLLPDLAGPRGRGGRRTAPRHDRRAERAGRADLHIHTVASDGTADVAAILDHVGGSGDLDVIAITDHERIDAAQAARAMAVDRGRPFEVVVGEEVTTLGGHLLALYVERPIRPYRSLRTTILDIHDAGGLAIPAHPLVPYPLCAQGWVLRRLLDDPDPAARPDALETFNPTALGRPWHDRVVRFADRHGLPGVGNSDAHALAAIGTGWTTFEGRTAADLRRAIETGATTATAARSTARPARSACSGSSCASARSMPATRSAAGSAATARAATTAIPAAAPARPATTRVTRAVKIGLVCPYIYPENGGVAQHVRFLYENLRLRGHDVRVITASHGPQRSSEGDIIRLGVGFSVPINASVGTLTFSPRYLTQIDDCSSASASTSSTSTSRSCPSCRCSCCASRRASTSRRSTPTPASRRRTSSAAGPCRATPVGCTAGSRSAPRRATSSTATSRATTRSSPTASTSRRYADAVPLARWQDGTPNVLFVGRHEPRKGLLDLLKAHRILRKTGSHASPAHRRLRARRSARRAATSRPAACRASSSWAGSRDAEKAQLFRTADVYASPATGGESFGIVLLEAMAAGHADRVLRHPRLQGRRPARPRGPARAAPRAPRSWPSPSTGCCATPALREQMGAAGQARAEEFSWSRVTAKVDDYYGFVIRRAGGLGHLPAGLPGGDPSGAPAGPGQAVGRPSASRRPAPEPCAAIADSASASRHTEAE